MNLTTTRSAFKETCIFINFRRFNFTTESDVTSTKVFVNHTAFCVVTAALSVLTICLNSITAMAYWRSTELKKKMALFLIMVLSLNDLGIGVFCGPLYVATFTRDIWLGKSSCFLTGLRVFVHLIIGGCSFKTLIIMNFERYFAIVHPLFHRTKITKGRLLKCLIIMWLVAGAVIVAFAFYPFDVFAKILTVEMLLSMAALVYIYARIYFTSSRSFENFRKTNRSNSSSQGQGTSQSERKQHLRNIRLVKSCFIVVVCYCICYLPFTIFNASFLKYHKDINLFGPWLTILLNLSNSTFNSLIFFWRNKLLRREAQRVLKQMICYA